MAKFVSDPLYYANRKLRRDDAGAVIFSSSFQTFTYLHWESGDKVDGFVFVDPKSKVNVYYEWIR